MFVFCISITQRQISPFIVIPNEGPIHAEYYSHDLMSEDEDTWVFQTWPGKWRADVFLFQIKDIRRYVRSSKIA
jgi:hypothetical protein